MNIPWYALCLFLANKILDDLKLLDSIKVTTLLELKTVVDVNKISNQLHIPKKK